MNVAKLKDIEGSFWGQNPALKLITPFAEFSKKKESDNVMKAIYLIYDAKSPLHATELPEDALIEDVTKNLLGKKTFDWSKYTEYVEAYKEYCTSDLHKSLIKMKNEVREVEKAISELSFIDEVEYEMRIKLNKLRKELLNDTVDIELKFQQEVSEQEIFGDYDPSEIEIWGLNNGSTE